MRIARSTKIGIALVSPGGSHEISALSIPAYSREHCSTTRRLALRDSAELYYTASVIDCLFSAGSAADITARISEITE
jgi:hypothetical protein